MSRHKLRRYRPLFAVINLLLFFNLVTGIFPPSLFQAQAASNTPADYLAGQTPTPLTVPPVTDPHLPGLVLNVTTDSTTVAVGDTVTLTVTVNDQASDPANNLVVTLPVPAGTQPVATGENDGLVSASEGWRWNVTRLEGNSSTTFTAQVKIPAMPPGEALLAKAGVTAKELTQPVERYGGAIVVDPTASDANAKANKNKADFTPGTATTLQSSDGKVKVNVPGNAYKDKLSLQHQNFREKKNDPNTPKDFTLPPSPGLKGKGFGSFFLEATDSQNNQVHQFDAPLTVSLSYTPQQLLALNLNASDLQLFWFDESKTVKLPSGATQNGQWEAVDSSVDPATGTVSAQVDHFSTYQFADGSSPSSAYLPSVQGWQTSLFTGSGGYSIPIDVPAGPGGLKPSLSMSYSSAATDGKSGQRPLAQASWVGKGWSLDTPAISYNKQGDYFSLVLDGQSFDIVRGAQIATDPDGAKRFVWKSTNEGFDKIVSKEYTGGSPMTTWQVWSKDGTRYDFMDGAIWGWGHYGISCDSSGNNCYRTGQGDYSDTQVYKYIITKVVDVNGNTINYNYGRVYEYHDCTTSTCAPGHFAPLPGWNYATLTPAIWPASITWGGNINTGAADRFMVNFVSSARTNDTSYDSASAVDYQEFGSYRETRELDAIQVMSMQASSWELVRQYNLGYDYSLTSDNVTNTNGTWAPTGYPKLTLKSVQRIGNDGTTALPATTFSYGAWAAGYDRYGPGGWNRLTGIDNGQGGTVTLGYDNIAAARGGDNFFPNYRRVTSRTTNDGMGHSYTWNYSYGTPNLNSVGTATKLGGQGTSANPNSAALFFNKFYVQSGSTTNQGYLAHAAYSELRGHDYTLETLPDGTKITHYFIQGYYDCTSLSDNYGSAYPVMDAYGDTPWYNPTNASRDIYHNTCFQKLRDQEFLKGKEYRTLVQNSAGQSMTETLHTFVTNFYDYGALDLSGMWHAFTNESQTDQKTYEATTTPLTKTTKYYYNPALQSGGNQYGNLTRTEEYDQNGALYKFTLNYYNTKDPGTYSQPGDYMVDRQISQVIYDGQSRLIGLTQYFYDNLNGYGVGAKGQLTRVSKYYDLPLQNSLANTTIHSSDTTYGYDAYGNQTSVTTYAGAGYRQDDSAGNSTYSSPGNGSATRTTTTTYDPTFHLYSIQADPPAVNGVILTEKAGYDYRMGTLTSITDPNNNVSTASYDVFGRLAAIVKPGDTPDIPTAAYAYYDTEKPFRYRIRQQEQAGVSGAFRPTQMFYDGFGQLIQTKTEMVNGAVNSVIDYAYDGLGRKVKTSMERQISETSSTTWFTYDAPGSDAIERWTTTTYDALGRPQVVTAPDNTQIVHHYGIWTDPNTGVPYLYHDTVDPDRHRLQQSYNTLGQLVRVDEISGNCGNYWGGYSCTAPYTETWAIYAATYYRYNPLGQLVGVTDAKSNVTSIGYDSLGRKTSMSDPDMGNWSYQYDVNGNLTQQTDAKSQSISFTYDAINRLTSKKMVGAANPYDVYHYDEAGVPNGKGQRTSMSGYSDDGSTLSATTNWEYSARGSIAKATYSNIPGMTGSRSFQWSYDSGDRLASLTYPSGETVNYSYDAGWRPTGLCSATTGNGCYITGVNFNVDAQQHLASQDQTFGNGLVERQSFTSLMQRLGQLQVGPAASLGSLFDRSYSFDNKGNITAIADNKGGQTQNFQYDFLDRLTHAWTTGSTTNAYDASYSYDQIGNINSKAGVSYSYPAAGSARPHTPTVVGGQVYSYDNNGNLQSGGNRSYSWNVENKPVSITSPSSIFQAEAYTYDGDGERITRTVGGVTTAYLGGGLWEEVVAGNGTGNTKSLYQFNGKTVALRDSSTAIVSYLHADHIGSVSLVTNASGTATSQQEFTPWGSIRSGGVSETTLGYTGQRLDGTGLMYYHARYYDPAVGKFASPDTIVPKQGDPQTFNRYGYAYNNPIKNNDATGHCPWCIIGGIAGGVIGFAGYTATHLDNWDVGAAAAWTGGGAVIGATGGAASEAVAGVFAGSAAASEAAVTGGALATEVSTAANEVDGEVAGEVASGIEETSVGSSGSFCSFSADTPVALANGDEKPIGDLKVGDEVLAYDQSTGSNGSYPVEAVLVHDDQAIEYITLDSNQGEQLETTPEHPFYTQDRGWVGAGDLHEGEQVRKADGSYGVVKTIRIVKRVQRMYNLTIKHAHTFFVGKLRWLVHNSCGDAPYGFNSADDFSDFGKTLHNGLRDAGYEADAVLQGSAVTGKSWSTGAPFGSNSDFDVGLISDDLFIKGLDVAGDYYKTEPDRIGPLQPEHLDQLGLSDVADTLSSTYDRPVNFMLYSSHEDAYGYGQSWPIAE
ncbi:MAG TPA: RHS repeat-associated core domain-containing protein [Chloroflexia bacterium]|nr:RHS repeat-associated core domain-containing protein [Chloroflexia bacterium]